LERFTFDTIEFSDPPLNKMLKFTYLFLGLITPTLAFAYLDPGTGSLLFQSLLVILFGIPVFLKAFRQKIITAFDRLISFFKKDN
jgi:energy-converting hydrogenase Eha subunit C